MVKLKAVDEDTDERIDRVSPRRGLRHQMMFEALGQLLTVTLGHQNADVQRLPAFLRHVFNLVVAAAAVVGGVVFVDWVNF